jgi:hypothetical protein
MWPWRRLAELTVTDGNGDPVMMTINGERRESAMICTRCFEDLIDRIKGEDEA